MRSDQHFNDYVQFLCSSLSTVHSAKLVVLMTGQKMSSVALHSMTRLVVRTGQKGRVGLCLFLIFVGFVILIYRVMQLQGRPVVSPDSVRLYIGIVNPSKVILKLGRLLHSTVLGCALFGEKPIPILKFQRKIRLLFDLWSDYLGLRIRE